MNYFFILLNSKMEMTITLFSKEYWNFGITTRRAYNNEKSDHDEHNEQKIGYLNAT